VSAQDVNRICDVATVRGQIDLMIGSIGDVESLFVQLSLDQCTLSEKCSAVGHGVITQSSESVRRRSFDLQSSRFSGFVVVDDGDRHDLFENDRLSHSVQSRPGPDVFRSQIVQIQSFGRGTGKFSSFTLPGTVGLIVVDPTRKIAAGFVVFQIGMLNRRTGTVVQHVLQRPQDLKLDPHRTHLTCHSSFPLYVCHHDGNVETTVVADRPNVMIFVFSNGKIVLIGGDEKIPVVQRRSVG